MEVSRPPSPASSAVSGWAMFSSDWPSALTPEERLDDAAGDHQRGADEVADRDPGDVLVAEALSISLPNSSGPVMPPAAVPIA